jgi:hypothetical protein
MCRTFSLVILLFSGQLMGSSWAQDRAGPQAQPSYPGGSEITFQWEYSCPSSKGCSFSCPGTGGASHVTKLNIYLGAIPISKSQTVPAVFYDFSTVEIPRANGFSLNTGNTALSCQINGMRLIYSGPPK